MTNKTLFLAVCLTVFFAACKTTKKGKPTPSVLVPETAQQTNKNELPKRANYWESREKKFDLIHTILRVSFDYEKQHVAGKATLIVKPYFYDQNVLELDARGFDIKEISLNSVSTQNNAKNTVPKKEMLNKPLKYTYQNDIITIQLDRTYTSKDELELFIEYVAKPNELKDGGSSAITSDKGLYFINPTGLDGNKPRQIWTQGETQSSSAWFPTIDSPNEKMTQEIYITVNKKDVTLSNGVLVYSTDNGNGTRTDYWKMEQPHSPYLVMLAIGEFEIIKDNWKDIEVSYYLEKAYAPYAREIFGNTPEMIDYYSRILGVPYPWQKYGQVVVRDYVSGAMENTTATLHGEFVQKTARELLDGNSDEIIAHELFHQWFGDLVTCESWPNLPLNESFATYGEYLWLEYKEGLEAADKHNQQGLMNYLTESRQKQVNMIRYDLLNREDMFDSHSYAKGGRILHMLRKTVGDKAFFESLNLYLTKHAYKSAEIHDLRLAFEEVTGQDLNWFFNQWFLASGHPKLSIQHQYLDSLKMYRVIVEQKQNLEKSPIYKLPIKVDVYQNNVAKTYNITIAHAKDTFYFPAESKPQLVNVDADKMLLCTKEELKSPAEYAFQFNYAPLYLDRYEALDGLAKKASTPEAITTIKKALNDKFWGIRNHAINLVTKLPTEIKQELQNVLKEIALKDSKNLVRENALYVLANDFNSPELTNLAEKLLITDSAYSIQSACLYVLKRTDSEKALLAAQKLENEKNNDLIMSIADVYKEFGNATHYHFFVNALKNTSGIGKYGLLQIYSQYLVKQDDGTISIGLALLEEAARNEKAWWVRLSAVQALSSISAKYETKEIETRSKIEVAQEAKDSGERINLLKAEMEKNKQLKLKINDLLKDIKSKETDTNLLRYFGDKQ